MAAKKSIRSKIDPTWPAPRPLAPHRSSSASVGEPIAYECWSRDGVHVLKGVSD